MARPSRIGNVLFADELILAGEFFLQYVGERMSMAAVHERSARYPSLNLTNEYFQEILPNAHLDATFYGNNARYANHSCNPNCESQAVELGGSGYYVSWLKDLRDIQPDEEIKSDYGGHQTDPDVLVICECDSHNCKGFI